MAVQKLLDTEDLPFCVESEREHVFVFVRLSASCLAIADHVKDHGIFRFRDL